MRHIAISLIVVTLAGLASCGSGSQTLPLNNNIPESPIEIGSQRDTPIQYAQEFPGALPKDALQPWEELGRDGKVISATSASSEFFEGTQSHFESGDTSSWNGALRMASGDVGAGNLSYAMYRVPLGGSEPGVVSVDANLRPMNDGNLGGYYVGLADYGNGSWQWFGPVTDAHWRISAVQAAREAARYTSGVGSVFVCVVAHDGAAIDVVGVGVDPVDLADTTAPDSPTGLVLTPVAGGIELAWTAVGGNDIAGYKVYYSSKAFGEFTAQFANSVAGLHGRSFILVADNQTWVAVSAVDKSGNESGISTVESARPLAGTSPEISLDVTGYSVMRGELVSLTAVGADTYDWDTDGDGIFDILDDASGTANVDTSQTGIIRPLVRGTGADSTSVALSAVSVIVASNSRPVAVAAVAPAFGNAPLPVVFTGTESTDFDGSIVGGGWDFDGDGTFDVWDDTDIVHVTSADHTFTNPGVYNAKLRVVDNEGAWDVDTLAVVVGDSVNAPPTAELSIGGVEGSGNVPHTVNFNATGSSDSDGVIVEYAWDWDGDGGYDTITDVPTMNYTYATAGVFTAKVRVTDNDWGRDTATVEITVNVPGNDSPTASLTVTPTYGDEGVTVTLDASGSFDPDGAAGIVNYEWDFDGDGMYDSYGSQDTATHAYNNYGVFATKVRVTDDAGAQATATADVRVNEVFNLDHPWGNHGHDDRHTRRSTYTGAQTNNLKWSFTTGLYVYSSPAIGADGTVYVGSWDDNLYAFNPDGSVRWSFTAGDNVASSPAIGADGTVYVGSWDNKLHAINQDGSLRWSYTAGDYVISSPAIGVDGTVYVGSWDDKLHAVHPDGSLKWEYTTGGDVNSSPAIGADGTVYVGSADGKLHAVNPDGTVNWEFTTGDKVYSSPAIGADGTVYVGSVDSKLYAINPDGTELWSFTTGNAVYSSPAIGADGTVYFGSSDSNLFAVNPDGTELWSYAAGSNMNSSPAIGADGTVYVGSEDNKLHAVNPDGTVKWEYTTGGDIACSPAIGADGTVYVGSDDRKFYAIGNNTGNTVPTAILQGSPLTGDTSIDVAFSAADSYDTDGTIDDYEWDFDGDGTYNETGAEADNQGEAAPPLQTYTLGPPVEAKLRVTDNGGATDTASVTVTVHGFSPQAVDTVGITGWFTSLATVDGYPAISYYDWTDADLKFVRATNAQGTAWGTPVAADPGGDVGYHTSLTTVDGFPAISYMDVLNSDLKYVRASNASGSSWGTPQTLDSTGIVGQYTSLAVVDGNPAISYDDFTNDDLKYVRATNAQGSTWGAPVAVDTAGDVGEYTSLAVVDGNPAISYYDGSNGNLKYVRSTNTSGSAWGSPLAVDTISVVGQDTCLVVVNGNPAISYYDWNSGSDNLNYVRATNATGSTWGTPVGVDTGAGQVGFDTSMVVVNGNPAISYYVGSGNYDLRYVRANDASGSTWATPQAIDSAGNVGEYTSIAMVAGYPAISYYDSTNENLKYVIMY